jgi:hypothetical protein
MENKLASLKNIDELRIESPRSLFNSTKSELPNVQDFQFIKPIAKGGYRYPPLATFNFLQNEFIYFFILFLYSIYNIYNIYNSIYYLYYIIVVLKCTSRGDQDLGLVGSAILADGLLAVDDAIAVGLAGPVACRVGPARECVVEGLDEQAPEARAGPRLACYVEHL